MTGALAQVLNGIDLTRAQMRAVMLTIMRGQCGDATMGALLAGLRMKGESIEEITAAAEVMRELALPVELGDTPHVVDIVGTGGDGANLFNVSTASALVAAAAGCHVAKHGSRGVSTSSGSSDLLQKAGVRLDLPVEAVTRCICEQGLGFLFAPNHHTAMRHAAGVRRELKARTLFNILGPLTNPARVRRAVIGVFNPALCEPLAHVMHNLGAKHVMVVGSLDGLDELSIASPSQVAELKDGQVRVYHLEPEDVGLTSQPLKGLMVNGSGESLALIQAAFAPATKSIASDQANNTDNNKDAIAQKAADMIALNAGAAIYVAGLADSHAEGVVRAQRVLSSGAAAQKLQAFATFTQDLARDVPAT
nr:anthranilate phosphoribosyltransferase [Moraxella atlantae]